MYSTIIQSSLQQNGISGSLGATNRVSVSFQNISNQTQTITVNITNVTSVTTVSFDTEAIGQTDLPAWTEYGLSPTARVTSGGAPVPAPNSTTTLTLAPMGTGFASWSLFCEFKNAYSCVTSNTGDSTDWVNNPDIRSVSFTSNFSIQVMVAEDRGAVLADVTSQLNLFTSQALNGPSNSRSMNGGRPF